MAVPRTILQEASSSQMDNEISTHNSLKYIVSFYFIFFNTFWFGTKFWEPHQFWDSGATSYYNLLLPPQNRTKNSIVFYLPNYSAYSPFFSFKRHQKDLFHFLARYLTPFTNPLSSRRRYILGLVLLFLQVYRIRFMITMFLNDSEMTLPSQLNTHFKRINLPIQTSPNWPAPSFFTNLIDSRGISHASLSHGFWGLGLIQAFSNFLHKPSDCPGFQRKTKIQNILHFCASQLETNTV